MADVIDLDAKRGHDGPSEGKSAMKVCGAKKRSGGKCAQKAGWGTDHVGAGNCKLHGGKTPSGRAAATKQLAHQEAQRMVARDGVELDPIDHLLDSLHLSSKLVHVWGAMVATIDDAAAADSERTGELRGALGYTENTNVRDPDVLHVRSLDRMLALNSKGEAQVHPYVREYQEALMRRARFAKLCIDAGIAERQVRMVEAQVELAQKALEATLDHLGLKGPERQDALEAHAKHLRLVG